jgi:putative transposase
MSKDAYHEMFVHMTWHTKESRPLILPNIENDLHDLLRRRALEPGGIFVYEIGGTENHVHMVVRINPNVAVPVWVGRIKGGSSHDFNQSHPANIIAWQSGYGWVHFGLKDLPWIRDYVRNQKEHHRTGNLFGRLERTEGDETTDG